MILKTIDLILEIMLIWIVCPEIIKQILARGVVVSLKEHNL
jgi:hypothetical protein